MVRGHGGLPRIGFKLRVGCDLAAGPDLARDERLELGSTCQFAEYDDSLA